jgi:hypothetical protein
MGDVHKEPRCLSSGREKEKGLEKIFGVVSTKRMLELFEIQSQSVSFLMHPCILYVRNGIHILLYSTYIQAVTKRTYLKHLKRRSRCRLDPQLLTLPNWIAWLSRLRQEEKCYEWLRMLREDKAIHAGIIAVEVDGVLGQLGHGGWVSTVLKLWI